MHFREELLFKAPVFGDKKFSYQDYISIFFRIIPSPGKVCPTICEIKSVMPDLLKKTRKRRIMAIDEVY